MLKLLALVAVILCNMSCGSRLPKPTKEILTLPNIQYLSTDSVQLSTTTDILKGKSVIIMYFDTECEICHKETTSLLKNLDDLANSHIYMLSRETLHSLKFYKNKYGITEDMPITIGKDINNSFINIYRVKSIPSTIIYNENHAIVKVFEGAVLWPDVKDEIDRYNKL